MLPKSYSLLYPQMNDWMGRMNYNNNIRHLMSYDQGPRPTMAGQRMPGSPAPIPAAPRQMPQQQQMGGMQQGQMSNPLMDLLKQYQAAHDKTNANNQSRYEAIRGGANDQAGAMGGYAGRYNKAMEMANLAASKEYKNANAKMQADLVNRGLSASSESPRANFDAFERSQQIPLQAHLNASGDALSFMERKNETGPSLDQMTNLAMQAGANQNMMTQLPQMMQLLSQLQNQSQNNNPIMSQLQNMAQQLQQRPPQTLAPIVNGGNGYSDFGLSNLLSGGFGGGGGFGVGGQSRVLNRNPDPDLIRNQKLRRLFLKKERHEKKLDRRAQEAEDRWKNGN